MGLLQCCFGISSKDRHGSWTDDSFCTQSTLEQLSNATEVMSGYQVFPDGPSFGIPRDPFVESPFRCGQTFASRMKVPVPQPVPQRRAPARTLSMKVAAIGEKVAAMRLDKDSISALLNAVGQVRNPLPVAAPREIRWQQYELHQQLLYARYRDPYSVWNRDAAGAAPRVPGAAAAQVQQEGSTTSSSSKQASPGPQPEPIPADEGLTSWNAHQYAAFKAHWLQAAAANRLYDTEAGLGIHEAELAAYLKQDSTTLFQTSSTGKSNLGGLKDGSSSSSSSPKKSSGSSGIKLSILPTRGLRRQATSGGHSSSSKSGSEDSLSWMQWLAFAEPPDVAVPSSLRMAAFIVTPAQASTSSLGYQGGSSTDISEA